jgi:hypothetical protein
MMETEAAALDAASQHVDSIEEANFSAALVVLSYHYEEAPVMGPKTSPRVQSIISRTLEKTHSLKDVRCVKLKLFDKRILDTDMTIQGNALA